MNLEMEKCEFQHHLNVFFEKSLDLDFQLPILVYCNVLLSKVTKNL
jgi:hypothetical protein